MKTLGELKYKLSKLCMMLNDGEHIEEHRILLECVNFLDKNICEDCKILKAFMQDWDKGHLNIEESEVKE